MVKCVAEELDFAERSKKRRREAAMHGCRAVELKEYGMVTI